MEIMDAFLDSEVPDLQFSQNDVTKVCAVARLLLSPTRADSSLLREKIEIGLSDSPYEALVLSHYDRLVSNRRLLRSTYAFIPPARALPINDEMHDPWTKKLFLGFARTSEFNGPRELICPHPLIQEVCTDFPIPEPMLQLPYRIFGSSPPMSYFDPAKMLTDSGKLHTLDKLLRHLRAENHRVLLFAQMTKMLDILERKSSHKKPPKSQDNDNADKNAEALIDGDYPESGHAEDGEHTAAARPKRSKRPMKSTGDDKEPVAGSDREKPADAAENYVSRDYYDTEEVQDRTPPA